MGAGVDSRQAAAVCLLWVVTLQLLKATLRLSADQRQRGFAGSVLTSTELSRMRVCVSAVCGGTLAAAAGPQDVSGHRNQDVPDWQALCDEATQLSEISCDDE